MKITHAFLLLALASALTALNSHAQTNLLVNPGFETAEPIDGIPTTTGDWGADLNSTVTAENGIIPRSGTQMLSFLHTSPGNMEEGSGADVIQLVDLSAYAAQIAAGNAFATFSAYFNRVSATDDTEFQVVIRAYSGSIANFPTTLLGASLGSATSNLSSDSNTATWELATTGLNIPTGATYLAVWVTALEPTAPFPNGTPYSPGPEFLGNYGDDASLLVTTVPEPSTYVMLAGLGALGLAMLRRRQHA